MIPFSIRHLNEYCMIVRLSPEAQTLQLLQGSRCIVDLAARPAFREMLSIPASEGYASALGVAPSLIYRARIAMGLGSSHGGKRARSGRRASGAPPLDLLAPCDMGINVQVVGSGAMRTLVVTLEPQPMAMIPTTQIIVEWSIIPDLKDFLSGSTIEDAQIALGLNNRSVVLVRKEYGISRYSGANGIAP